MTAEGIKRSEAEGNTDCSVGKVLKTMSKFSFSVFTKDGGPLTKIIRPNPDGTGIEKDGSQCRMHAGTVKTYSCTLEKFGAGIRKLRTNQAIAHGVCECPAATVVSERNFSGQPDTITRTKKYFGYPAGPGLGMFDHDPKPGQTPLSPEKFREIIEQICPTFHGVATLFTPSTSSCIFDASGKELAGKSAGFHLYFVIENARQLPIFAETLFKHLVLAGHGCPFVTRSGSVLVRTIFDLTVFSPERLDFVAGAVCEGGCYQRLPDPIYTEGGMLKWKS